jgi:drug/metabolite transporter (DMT)-like permease
LSSARIYVALAALLFSTGGAGIKLSALSSWQIAGFRSGIAAVVLFALLPAWRGVFDQRALGVGVAFAATMILYVTANTLTTAANAIFLQTSAPLYVLLLGPLLLRESLRRSDLWVVALLVAGLALFFVGTEPPLATAPDPALGNALAAASGVTWAFTVVGLRWLGREPQSGGRDPTGAAVVVGNAIAFAVCLPFALPLGPSTALDWGVVTYLGMFQIGLAYVCMVRGVRGVRALEVSLLLVLEPVLNALLSWAVHGEVPGSWAAAGCAVILTGLVFQALRAPAEA